MIDFIQPTPLIDSDHPNFKKVVASISSNTTSVKELAIKLYLKVRDGWQYNPYNITFEKDKVKASYILEKEDGHCIDKGVLLVAFCRAAKIPARLCLSKVRNHIATEKFETFLGTNILVPHGYVEIFIDNKWVKATPAFNKGLCEKLNVPVLEFDGINDSLFQQFDHTGKNFMEYMEDYGHFEDIPLKFMRTKMIEHYPKLLDADLLKKEGFNIKL